MLSYHTMKLDDAHFSLEVKFGSFKNIPKFWDGLKWASHAC